MEAKNLKKMDVGGLSGILLNKTGMYVCKVCYIFVRHHECVKISASFFAKKDNVP